MNDSYRAVGISCLIMKALAQLLSDSILAPDFVGPKQLIPLSSKTSAKPFANGSSGPTITNSIQLLLQKLATL